jgi:putative SOS response-associated peptidase YedK
MCGRYASFLPPEAVARFFRTTNALPNIGPSWNVAPSQRATVVRRHPETGERHLDLLKWGLLPFFTKDPVHAKRPINARAETVTTSGMFRSAFARRSCIVPADAFYEWKAIEAGKQPYAIARQDAQPMAFAGLWEGFKWTDGTVPETFTILHHQRERNDDGAYAVPLLRPPVQRPAAHTQSGRADGADHRRAAGRVSGAGGLRRDAQAELGAAQCESGRGDQ